MRDDRRKSEKKRRKWDPVEEQTDFSIYLPLKYMLLWMLVNISGFKFIESFPQCGRMLFFLRLPPECSVYRINAKISENNAKRLKETKPCSSPISRLYSMTSGGRVTQWHTIFFSYAYCTDFYVNLLFCFCSCASPIGACLCFVFLKKLAWIRVVRNLKLIFEVLP